MAILVQVGTPARTNAAVTFRAALIDTVQVGAVPEQAPLHPLKAWPVAGAAVIVTLVPWLNTSEQSLPQLMPAGAELTAPDPVTDTVSASPNRAPTVRAPPIVTAHAVELPVQEPLHAMN